MDRIRWQGFNKFLDPQKAMGTVTQSKGTLVCNNSNGEHQYDGFGTLTQYGGKFGPRVTRHVTK